MAKFKILIADDDEDDFFLMKSAFNESGENHQLDHVKDGQSLLDYLYNVVKNNEAYPDLILLDINMPRIDGMLALELLKSSDIFSSIPVIMCTTAWGEEIEHNCRVMGASGFITKGAGYTKVVEMVEAINYYLHQKETNPDMAFVYKHETVGNKRDDL